MRVPYLVEGELGGGRMASAIEDPEEGRASTAGAKHHPVHHRLQSQASPQQAKGGGGGGARSLTASSTEAVKMHSPPDVAPHAARMGMRAGLHQHSRTKSTAPAK